MPIDLSAGVVESKPPLDLSAGVVAPTAPEAPSSMSFVKNLASSAGRFAGDIAGAVTSPIQTGKALYGLGAGAVQSVIPGEQGSEKNLDALVDLYKQRYGSIDNLLQTLYTDPVGVGADVATLAGGAGAAAKIGNLPKVAKAAGVVASVTDPLAVAGKVAGGARAAAAGKMESRARGMYQSALKPPPGTTSPPVVEKAVTAGLENRIPISKGGVQKLDELVDDLNGKIAAELAANPQATVSRNAAAKTLRDVKETFRNQVNPTSDIQAITQSGREFVATQPKQILVGDAQKLKQGTYRQLKDKAYREGLKSATIEAQKALARGLKEEIAAQFQEIADLNAKESKLLTLEPLLERAVRRIDNRELFGIGGPIMGGGVAAASGSAKAGAAVWILRSIIDHPEVKSRLAIILNQAAKRNPGKYGRVTIGTTLSRIQAYRDSLAPEEVQE